MKVRFARGLGAVKAGARVALVVVPSVLAASCTAGHMSAGLVVPPPARLATAAPLTAGDIGIVAVAQPAPDVMWAHFIDVGQGDATLLEFPCAAVLVDTGSEFNGGFDGKAAITGYLEEFFERRADLNGRLDLLVLTHPHIDHTRNVKVVLNTYRPRNIVTNGQEKGSGKWQQRDAHRYAADSDEQVGFYAVKKDAVTKGGTSNEVIDPIDCGSVDPKLSVLWGQVGSDPGWGSHFGKKRFDNANNHSVVLRVDFGKASLLLTGDLEEEAIEDLIEHHKGTTALDVDVYQVGHHGSANGTTTTLMTAMSPATSVISMGPPDRDDSFTAYAFGHPRQTIIELLEQGTSENRSSMDVLVATGVKTFAPRTLSKAVYATGWDGDVVIAAKSDGTITLTSPVESQAALIDLNTATISELISLPLIGAAKAKAIVDDRDANGAFDSVDDLTRVKGIGAATLQAVRQFVTVTPMSPPS